MAEQNKPDPAFVAQQLRQPSGEAAEKIGEKMNVVNKPLFDLTLNTMQLDDRQRLLEIGFGTGKYFDKIFSNANDLEVYGIDFSKDMVDMARSDNTGLVDSGKLKLIYGQSDRLPFDDHTFDKVFCNMVIYFWEQPEEHLREIKRVLKPGGRFYTGIRTRESMLQFPFVQYGFILYELKEWISLLQQNGFEYIDKKQSSDPVIEDKEQDRNIQLESVCIVAEK